MSDERDALREELAALAHTQWSGWMRYMVSRCVPAPGDDAGVLVIPVEWMERWQRQMDTAYADLPEHDKESDRTEADRVLALLPQGERDALMAALVQEYAAILRERGVWAELGYEATVQVRRGGACFALQRVAERLGVIDLHERAAEVVARGEEGEEP